eukprot:SAG31_NODE_17566_length_666_cov_1.174603_1_plen_132_part_00
MKCVRSKFNVDLAALVMSSSIDCGPAHPTNILDSSEFSRKQISFRWVLEHDVLHNLLGHNPIGRPLRSGWLPLGNPSLFKCLRFSFVPPAAAAPFASTMVATVATVATMTVSFEHSDIDRVIILRRELQRR